MGIGGDRGAISDAVGASLIGAGMISLLVFPLLATRVCGHEVDAAAAHGHAPVRENPADG